jgi:hypothetical protein
MWKTSSVLKTRIHHLTTNYFFFVVYFLPSEGGEDLQGLFVAEEAQPVLALTN